MTTPTEGETRAREALALHYAPKCDGSYQVEWAYTDRADCGRLPGHVGACGRAPTVDSWAHLRALVDALDAPIPMLLFCPACGVQHIDALDPNDPGWTNPPHRSHTCRIADNGCGHIWRPCDRATAGVAKIETKGTKDSEPTVPVLIYSDGHEAGGRARFARCKEDIARVLGHTDVPGWEFLVGEVRAALAKLAEAYRVLTDHGIGVGNQSGGDYCIYCDWPIARPWPDEGPTDMVAPFHRGDCVLLTLRAGMHAADAAKAGK